jgi:GNAT superfamily N-acetyltransferase
MHVRVADASDAECLARLLRSYLDEGYPGHVGCTADELRRDVLGSSGHQHVLLVEQHGIASGFLAWDEVYDMHWAMRGAQIADIYVASSRRGHGAALLLIARACREAHALGGTFLRGSTYDRESTRRFFSRVAVVAPSGDAHLSGRAFRHLAQLNASSVRELLPGLPLLEWNHEA